MCAYTAAHELPGQYRLAESGYSGRSTEERSVHNARNVRLGAAVEVDTIRSVRLVGQRLVLLRAIAKAVDYQTGVGIDPGEVAAEIGIDAAAAQKHEDFLTAHRYLEGITLAHVGITQHGLDTLEEMEDEEVQQAMPPNGKLLAQLQAAREKLAKLPPLPWSGVEAWIVATKPIVRVGFKDHLADFEAVTQTPRWAFLGRVFHGGDSWTGTPPMDDSAEREAQEKDLNANRAKEAREKILAFVDSLLDLEVEEGVKMTDATTVPTTPTRIFVSHSAADKELADHLVEFLCAALEFPRDALLCTSVHGHKLELGDSSSVHLRAHIRSASVVVGLLTEKSLESQFVLMELGAAWGLEKRAILLLGPNTKFPELPGPFKDIHAAQATVLTDVLDVVDTIEKRCGYKKVSSAAVHTKAQRFVGHAASAGVKPLEKDESKDPPPPALPERNYIGELASGHELQSDETVRMKLVIWLKKNESTEVADGVPVEFSRIDKEAGIPPGNAERLITQAVEQSRRPWEEVTRGGGFIHLQLGPDQVVDVMRYDRYGRRR